MLTVMHRYTHLSEKVSKRIKYAYKPLLTFQRIYSTLITITHGQCYCHVERRKSKHEEDQRSQAGSRKNNGSVVRLWLPNHLHLSVTSPSLDCRTVVGLRLYTYLDTLQCGEYGLIPFIAILLQ
jgi:hypothetical protein